MNLLWLRMGLLGALLAGLGMVGVGIERWHAGHAAGAAEEKAHADQVLATLRERQRAELEAANARADAISEQWRTARQGADREREKERAATQAARAADAADLQRMRDQLAAAAAGGVEAADDTVAACRDRAAAFGRLLGEALRAGGDCAADAEDLGTSVRTLQRAWPVTPQEAAP